MIQALVIMLTVSGMATNYQAPEHLGNPLYCDRGCGLVYDESINFAAIPVSWYSGDWDCGDTLIVDFGSKRIETKALDAGAFERNCIQLENECIPIVIDLPDHNWTFDGISHRVKVLNLSLLNRIVPNNCKVDYLRK